MRGFLNSNPMKLIICMQISNCDSTEVRNQRLQSNFRRRHNHENYNHGVQTCV
jgi:hypothetical protein